MPTRLAQDASQAAGLRERRNEACCVHFPANRSQVRTLIAVMVPVSFERSGVPANLLGTLAAATADKLAGAMEVLIPQFSPVVDSCGSQDSRQDPRREILR